MDPLSDVIALLRPHAALSKPITGRGRWGVRYESHDAPSFCVVAVGHCWLAFDDGPPWLLERGDFLLLPSTPAFTMTSHPGAVCTEGRPSGTAVRHGETGEPDFVLFGGTFQIEPANAGLLSQLLPAPLRVRSAEVDTSRLVRMVDLIVEEGSADRPGRAMILERLVEILLVEALRWSGDGYAALPAGLLAGLRDPELAEAFRAMHADVRYGWTVAELARRADMSRSAFAKRFTSTVGCAPMAYLANWRMALAQDALSRGGRSLAAIAQTIGFESASAFSTAFRRRTGQAPGAFARLHRRDIGTVVSGGRDNA